MGIPLILAGCILAGAFLRIGWGISQNRDPFDWRKMIGNVILTIVAVAGEVALMLGADIILNSNGVAIFAINAFLLGWAIDDVKKQSMIAITNIQNK